MLAGSVLLLIIHCLIEKPDAFKLLIVLQWKQFKPAKLAFFQEFFPGGRAKSIVMLIFLLFSDQILGVGGKVTEGRQTASGGGPRTAPPLEESQRK